MVTKSYAVTARLPRTRGDGPRRIVVGAVVHEASPHTRGWTPYLQREATALEGFPAHAGMDLLAWRCRTSLRRLPRTRGDGPWTIRLCL